MNTTPAVNAGTRLPGLLSPDRTAHVAACILRSQDVSIKVSRGMRTLVVAVAGLLACAVAASAIADDAASCGDRAPGDARPRIGLALGGGGARGVAHVSVLKALEEEGIRVDCIAGTSVGALVGALYASGMSAADIEKLVLSFEWKRLFDDSLERPERSIRRKEEDRLTLSRVGVGVGRGGQLKIATGILAGQRILMLFERLTLPVSAIEDFDRLPIPFRAVATDLNTGGAVVLGDGSLAQSMRASMSLPGIFEPIEIDGRVLLDGGLVKQVPIDVVRDMGADIVIAVDVGTPLLTLTGDASLVAVLDQMIGIMTVGNARAQLATLTNQDLLIVPALGEEVGTADFDKGELALRIGADAANAARPRFAVLAAGGSGVAVAHVPQDPSPTVHFVRLENSTAYDDQVFLSRIDVPLGEPLDADALESQLQKVYGIDTFALVAYEVVEEDGRSGVLIRATPKAFGPHYLQAGLTLNSDFDGDFGANLRLGVLTAPISKYGAEARVLAQIGSEPGLSGEVYFPMDARNRNIILARGGYESIDVNRFDGNGNKLASYDAQQTALQVAWVREFGNWGSGVLDVRRGTGNASINIGDPALAEIHFDIGEVAASLLVDRLDNPYFPRDGYFARVSYLASREGLGADTDFDQVDIDALGANRFGLHAFQFGLRYHTTINGTAPIQSLYRLGGRSTLAGFRRNELTGQHYAVVFGGYLYELADVFGRAALIGGTVEYGNAWQHRDDIAFDDGIFNASAYFGFDSWLGPLLFGYGAREGGEGTVFLEIGQRF